MMFAYLIMRPDCRSNLQYVTKMETKAFISILVLTLLLMSYGTTIRKTQEEKEIVSNGVFFRPVNRVDAA